MEKRDAVILKSWQKSCMITF